MMIRNRPGTIAKVLGANDIGLTGGHQAGILIPKTGSVLSFFPVLDESIKNPRATVEVTALEAGLGSFKLALIHYNNKIVGSGTRNEYRLTGMTALLRSLRAEVGDVLVFQRTSEDHVDVRLARADRGAGEKIPRESSESSSDWSIVEIE